MEYRACFVRKRISVYRAEVTGVKTSFGIGDKPVLTWLERDRRRPRGEFFAMRIMSSNCYFYYLSIHGQELVHQNYDITRNRSDLFQHRLSQVYVAALDAFVNYRIGDSGEVDKHTVSLLDLSVLYKRRDFVDEKRKRARTVHAIPQRVKHDKGKGRETERRYKHNDVNPDAIRKALANMKDNSEYMGEYKAGQARLYADWLVGLAMTRYITISLREAGYKSDTLSVGRVQTPTLGLVVFRDGEIKSFSPSPYYELTALLSLDGNRKIKGHWLP